MGYITPIQTTYTRIFTNMVYSELLEVKEVLDREIRLSEYHE